MSNRVYIHYMILLLCIVLIMFFAHRARTGLGPLRFWGRNANIDAQIILAKVICASWPIQNQNRQRLAVLANTERAEPKLIAPTTVQHVLNACLTWAASPAR